MTTSKSKCGCFRSCLFLVQTTVFLVFVLTLSILLSSTNNTVSSSSKWYRFDHEYIQYFISPTVATNDKNNSTTNATAVAATAARTTDTANASGIGSSPTVAAVTTPSATIYSSKSSQRRQGLDNTEQLQQDYDLLRRRQYQYKEENTNSDSGNTGGGFSACLLIKDENHRLGEWIAYHYFALPLTQKLIVFIAPESKQDPTPILEKWYPLVEVEIWDDSFLSKFRIHRTDPLQTHRNRQINFYKECAYYLQGQNKTWTAFWDADEYVRLNHDVFDRLRRRKGGFDGVSTATTTTTTTNHYQEFGHMLKAITQIQNQKKFPKEKKTSSIQMLLA